MKRPEIRNAFGKLNLPLVISDHIFGDGHTERHRMIVGIAVIFAGVAVSKFPFGGFVIHYLCDAVGYGIHGVGCIPFVEALARKKQG